MRLGLFFGTTARFWLNMRAHYGLEIAGRSIEMEEIRGDVTPNTRPEEALESPTPEEREEPGPDRQAGVG